MVTVWYALHGHAPEDVASHRTRARWYTTKTEPSYDDMAVKLRRVILAARFRNPSPEQATPQETRAVLAAGRRWHMINQNCETRGVQADDLVVGGQADPQQRGSVPGVGPLAQAAADGAVRAARCGDAFVAAAVHERADQMLEHDSVGEARR